MSSGEPPGVHIDSQVISAVCLEPVSPVLLHLNVVFLRKQSLSNRNNMESREEEPEEETQRSFLEDEDTENIQPPSSATTTSTTTAASPAALGPNPAVATDAQSDDEETGEKPLIAAASTKRTEDEEEVEEECGGKISAGSEEGEEDEGCKEDELHKVSDVKPAGGADSEEKSLTPTRDRPAPPSTLALSSPQPVKKKVLVAPTLSLSLGRSESTVSDDLPSVFLSPSPEDEDDTALDFDLDAMETPSDNESLAFPMYDLNMEDDLRRLGVASSRHRGHGSSPRCDSKTGSLLETDQSGLGFLEREDVVDSHGIKWRCFATGDPPQESRANMSVLEPFLRVLSHGGYYGDGMNDIIVFSSCYLPENSLENYQYVMDNLFRFVVGTLELMVAENYVIVYLCAGGQKEKLPGISWLRECYTTIDRRLRKNLKGFYVVHPTWYIKALITIIKPFISTKFSRKLQFINSLKELSNVIPTEHVQIPDCVRQYDEKRSR